jgi:glycosyltransferase involved in cell wall biosynthesis
VDWPEGQGPDTGALAGAAYAILIPFEQDDLGAPLLNAWKAGVPAIVAEGGLLAEMAGEAAGAMVSGEPASLAAQLMRIYTAEHLRATLIAKGFERVKDFSRELSLRAIREGTGM